MILERYFLMGPEELLSIRSKLNCIVLELYSIRERIRVDINNLVCVFHVCGVNRG